MCVCVCMCEILEIPSVAVSTTYAPPRVSEQRDEQGKKTKQKLIRGLLSRGRNHEGKRRVVGWCASKVLLSLYVW